MGKPSTYDFSGYATKSGVRCSDGRVILKDAFKHHDGQQVPLVWQHKHDVPTNVLGHAVLENRTDGVYAYCKLNNTESGKNTRELVKNGDINALSIYANSLQQRGSEVIHGNICEVSLVIKGANPEAFIENLNFAHADGTTTVDESEAIMYLGEGLDLGGQVAKHTKQEASVPPEKQPLAAVVEDRKLPEKQDEGENTMSSLKHAEDKTVQEVFDELTEEQKQVVYFMIGAALEEAGLEGGGDEEEMEQSGKGEVLGMKHNVFDNYGSTFGAESGPVLTHDQITNIFTDAKKMGSLKEAVLAHAAEFGIENIDILFPDARNVRDTPDLVKREDDWVSDFLRDVTKTPFARIRSKSADLTEDEARAKGYITGNRKREEVFPVMKRETTPTTIYKKQKLNRDDVVDITDFDVVAWMKVEMRGLLNEEIARAALIGDGRDVSSEDKVNPLNIRPVWEDDELFAPKYHVDAEATNLDLIDEFVRAGLLYKGSGVPNLYSTRPIITEMLLVRDTIGRRIYPTINELASAMGVRSIVFVEVMEDQTREINGDSYALKGILLNPKDYTMGANKGGEVSLFDDFDIDYNQYKYLIETRLSGALTRPKSAVVVEQRVDEVEANG